MADHEHTAHESTSPKFWITWLRFRPIYRRLASRINGLAVAGRRKLGLARLIHGGIGRSVWWGAVDLQRGGACGAFYLGLGVAQRGVGRSHAAPLFRAVGGRRAWRGAAKCPDRDSWTAARP